MELYQLRYFKKIVECGSLTKAADELFITVPSISTAISKLEKEIGAPLFDRIHQRMYLNNSGRMFYDFVNKGLATIDNGLINTRKEASYGDNRLMIGTTNQTLWNKMILGFLKINPSIKLSHQILKRTTLSEPNSMTQYDFIFTYDAPLVNGFEHIKLSNCEKVYVCLPDTHPLSNNEEIDLLDLKNESFIFPPTSPWLNNFYYSMCRSNGFEPKVIAECGFVLMSYLFEEGMGIMFTTEQELYLRNEPHTKCIPIKNIITDTIPSPTILINTQKPLNNAANRFKDYVFTYYNLN